LKDNPTIHVRSQKHGWLQGMWEKEMHELQAVFEACPAKLRDKWGTKRDP